MEGSKIVVVLVIDFEVSSWAIVCFQSAQKILFIILAKQKYHVTKLHSFDRKFSYQIIHFVYFQGLRKRVTAFRGHSRNWPKGGRNFPQRCSSTHLRTASLCFYSLRVQKPLQITWPAVFGTKLRLIHLVRFAWRHKITNFLSKNSFVKVKGWSRDHRDL